LKVNTGAKRSGKKQGGGSLERVFAFRFKENIKRKVKNWGRSKKPA